MKGQKRIISSADIERILTMYNSGYKITRKNSIFYENIIGTLNKKFSLFLTTEELAIYAKCFNSKRYFIEEILGIKLHPFQVRWIESYEINSNILFINSRQVGFTSIIVALMLWEVIFNQNCMSNIILCGDKKNTSMEKLDRLWALYLKLPYFLKPNLYFKNRTRFKLNNTKIVANDIKNIVDADIVLLDDFSYYKKSIDFTKISNRCRLFLSVSNTNHSYTQNILSGEEDSRIYDVIRTYWYDVPNRDSKWRDSKIKAIGTIITSLSFSNLMVIGLLH